MPKPSQVVFNNISFSKYSCAFRLANRTQLTRQRDRMVGSQIVLTYLGSLTSVEIRLRARRRFRGKSRVIMNLFSIRESVS